MPISGYILRVNEAAREAVAGALGDIPQVTLGELRRDAICLALETRAEEEGRRFEDRVAALPGVLTVNLVYHNFEDLYENAEAGPSGRS